MVQRKRVIMRLLAASCSLFFLMYSHTFLVTSVRGSGLAPTMAASSALGVIGFMNAELAARLGAAAGLAVLVAGLDVVVAAFFAVAMEDSFGWLRARPRSAAGTPWMIAS